MFQVCGMTDKQLALLLLNESLFSQGRYVCGRIGPWERRIDLLAFCVGPEIIIAIPTSYGLCSKATDTHLFCLYCNIQGSNRNWGLLQRLSPILKVRLSREEKVKEIDQERVGQVIFRNPEGSNEKYDN